MDVGDATQALDFVEDFDEEVQKDSKRKVSPDVRAATVLQGLCNRVLWHGLAL